MSKADTELLNMFSMLVKNSTLLNAASTMPGTRMDYISKLRAGKRGIDAIADACGYVVDPTPQQMRDQYDTDGIAARVVNIYPEETWVHPPEISENLGSKDTSFEKAFVELERRVQLWYNCAIADELSGIGGYGILFLGYDDGPNPERPVNEKRVNNLLYVQPFDELDARVTELETDISNERYGLPVNYMIKFGAVDSTTNTATVSEVNVHWSRVIHIAEPRGGSRWRGAGKMAKVFPALQNIMKILGGSAEMFWGGGFPGLAVENMPGLNEAVEFDKASVATEMRNYFNKMQRWLGFENLSVKTLDTNIADPSNHIAVQYANICTAIQAPVKVFMGTEAGHMASQEDTLRWNTRIGKRQNNVTNPIIVIPLIERLIRHQALPKPKQFYSVWEDLNLPSNKERADFGLKITQAMLQYVSSGAETIMPLYEYLTFVLRFSHTEAQAIIAATKTNVGKLVTKKLWGMGSGTQTSSQTGKDPAARTGGGGKRNGLGQ
jgi:hypothetical protein